ncbi:NAD(P)-binding protein, partial [Ascobolus immersus RN42]
DVVLITGGCGGVGRGVVEELVRRVPGTKVVVLDAVEWGGEKPPNVHTYKVDLTNIPALTSTISSIQATHGLPTILINNAGICHGKFLLDTTPSDLQKTFSVNLFAHHTLLRLLLPSMIENNHGHIITIGSITAHLVAPRLVDYAASKAAVLSLHEGLSMELRHVYKARKVRTSIILPGHIKTELFRGYDNTAPGFLVPSLEVGTVVEEVVKTVLGGRSRHVVVPVAQNAFLMVSAVPSWPLWLQTEARDHAATNMANFQGRQVLDPDAERKEE